MEPLDQDLNHQVLSPKRDWVKIIFTIVEIFLWLVTLAALLFKFESWEGSSEMMILALALLGVFYSIFLWAVAGGRGWKKILASFGLGNAIMLLLYSKLFLIESWEGGHEMRILGLMFFALGLILTGIFTYLSKAKGKPMAFYGHIWLRIALVFLVWGI